MTVNGWRIRVDKYEHEVGGFPSYFNTRITDGQVSGPFENHWNAVEAAKGDKVVDYSHSTKWAKFNGR